MYSTSEETWLLMAVNAGTDELIEGGISSLHLFMISADATHLFKFDNAQYMWFWQRERQAQAKQEYSLHQ